MNEERTPKIGGIEKKPKIQTEVYENITFYYTIQRNIRDVL